MQTLRLVYAVGLTTGLLSIVSLLPAPLQAGEDYPDLPPPLRPEGRLVPSSPTPPSRGGAAPGPVARAPQAPTAPAGPEPVVTWSAQDLRELVGPIALYPDVVLASLLPASAAPLDIVQAARWLREREGEDAAPPMDRGWDRSVVALLQFPDLVLWLDENLRWLEDLGHAVASQPADVMTAIQAFRETARAAGALPTNEFQRVETRELPPPADAPPGTEPATVVVIEPAQPEVVYLPVYDPVVILEPYPVAVPVVTFSACWTFGSVGACAWHDLAWGWPCGGGYWGGGVYSYARPWYGGHRHATPYYARASYAPTRWQPAGRASAYAPRARGGEHVGPGRPAWDRGVARGGEAVAQAPAARSRGGAFDAGVPTARRGLTIPPDAAPRERRRAGRDGFGVPALGSAPPAPVLDRIPPSLGSTRREASAPQVTRLAPRWDLGGGDAKASPPTRPAPAVLAPTLRRAEAPAAVNTGTEAPAARENFLPGRRAPEASDARARRMGWASPSAVAPETANPEPKAAPEPRARAGWTRNLRSPEPAPTVTETAPRREAPAARTLPRREAPRAQAAPSRPDVSAPARAWQARSSAPSTARSAPAPRAPSPARNEHFFTPPSRR